MDDDKVNLDQMIAAADRAAGRDGSELHGLDEVMAMVNRSLPDEMLGPDAISAMNRDFLAAIPQTDPIPLYAVPKESIPVLYLPHYAGIPELIRLDQRRVGIDIFCASQEGFNLNTSERSVVTVGCGFALSLPENIEVQIRPLSELTQIGVVAQFGTIDASHRSEVAVTLVNVSGRVRRIERGQRIAQMVFTGNLIRTNLVSVSENSWAE